MTDRPWYQWYPQDIRGERTYKLCSPMARLVWRECLDLMHDAPTRGYLVGADSQPFTVAEIAKLIDLPAATVARAIDELKKRQTCSYDEAVGAIYSRRMVRDEQRSRRNADNGKQGGNPKLVGSDKRPDKRPDKRRNQTFNKAPDKANAGARDRVQNPESRSTLESQKQIPEAPNEPAPNVAANAAPDEGNTITAAAWIRDVFVPLYAKYRAGAVYFVAWSKHAPIVARLLKAHDSAHLRRLAVILLRTDDEWIATTDRGLEVLSAKVNWLEDRLREWEAKRAS